MFSTFFFFSLNLITYFKFVFNKILFIQHRLNMKLSKAIINILQKKDAKYMEDTNVWVAEFGRLIIALERPFDSFKCSKWETNCAYVTI